MVYVTTPNSESGSCKIRSGSFSHTDAEILFSGGAHGRPVIITVTSLRPIGQIIICVNSFQFSDIRTLLGKFLMLTKLEQFGPDIELQCARPTFALAQMMARCSSGRGVWPSVPGRLLHACYAKPTSRNAATSAHALVAEGWG
jgi:hypothetical protein